MSELSKQEYSEVQWLYLVSRNIPRSIPSEILSAKISEVTVHVHSQKYYKGEQLHKLYRQEYSESIGSTRNFTGRNMSIEYEN